MLTFIIITVFVLGMLLFIGVCLSLPGIIRGILGTDAHTVKRHVREALEEAEVEATPGTYDPKAYLRQRRAERQRIAKELDEMLRD